MALELPFGIRPTNPLPVDAWSGPYTGADEATALAAANAAIPVGVRFPTMTVRLVINGVGNMYWYKNGTTDGDLVAFGGGGTSLQNGSGLTFDTDHYDWDGALTKDARITGGPGATSFNLFLGGENFLSQPNDKLGYVEMNSNDGMWFTNYGTSGAYQGFPSFMEWTNTTDIGQGLMTFSSWTNNGQEAFLNFNSGQDVAGNYFGLPYQPHDGNMFFTVQTIRAEEFRMSLRGSTANTYNMEFSHQDTVSGGINGFFIYPTTGFRFWDTINGRGINYFNSAADEANIDWNTDVDHVPSIRLINENVGAQAAGSGLTANIGTGKIDAGGLLTADALFNGDNGTYFVAGVNLQSYNWSTASGTYISGTSSGTSMGMGGGNNINFTADGNSNLTSASGSGVFLDSTGPSVISSASGSSLVMNPSTGTYTLLNDGGDGLSYPNSSVVTLTAGGQLILNNQGTNVLDFQGTATFTDPGAGQGLEYLIDYTSLPSATALTLATKGYVDGVVTSLAGNGLVSNLGALDLGGTLTADVNFINPTETNYVRFGHDGAGVDPWFFQSNALNGFHVQVTPNGAPPVIGGNFLNLGVKAFTDTSNYQYAQFGGDPGTVKMEASNVSGGQSTGFGQLTMSANSFNLNFQYNNGTPSSRGISWNTAGGNNCLTYTEDYSVDFVGNSLVTRTWVEANTLTNASVLNDLSNVNINAASDGDVLTFNSGTGEWVNSKGKRVQSIKYYLKPQTTGGQVSLKSLGDLDSWSSSGINAATVMSPTVAFDGVIDTVILNLTEGSMSQAPGSPNTVTANFQFRNTGFNNGGSTLGSEVAVPLGGSIGNFTGFQQIGAGGTGNNLVFASNVAVSAGDRLGCTFEGKFTATELNGISGLTMTVLITEL